MQAICSYLERTYHPHAVILYGSYADGSNGEGSDFDALLIADGSVPAHDSSMIGGVQLDVWLISTNAVADVSPADYTHVLPGQILLDERGTAQQLLSAIRFADESIPMPDDESISNNIAWCRKMLRRTQRGDAEACYRWHWLLTDSLEIACQALRIPYRGPKKSLRQLESIDPDGFALYCDSLLSIDSPALPDWVDHIEALWRCQVIHGEAHIRRATLGDLLPVWQHNIDTHPDDPRWERWRDEYIGYHESGAAEAFVIRIGGECVGEGTLLYSPSCSAISGRIALADGAAVANVNALRIRKAFEGRGHVSAMMRLMERHAASRGITRLTIGVEECEARNRAIYEHMGYTIPLFTEVEDGATVLYYAKDL